VGQFYRANSLNAIGAPARVVLTANTYAAPTNLDQIIDVIGGTYNLTAAYGWVDIGMTDVATKFQNQVNVTQWRSEQTGQFRDAPMDWMATANFEAIEMTQQNKVNLLSGVKATDAATGQSRTNFVALTSLPVYRIACLMMDANNKIHATVLPKAQWDGSAIATEMARGNPQKIPVAFHCYPDDTVIDPTTGLSIFRFDLDQM
jgi:hypothetical protein